MVIFDTPRIGQFRGRMMLMAHLGSTDIDSLHELAEQAGLKRTWFQEHPRFPHYDLLGIEKIDSARAAGAIEVTGHEFIKTLKAGLQHSQSPV